MFRARTIGVIAVAVMLAACAGPPAPVHDVRLLDLRTESEASFIGSLNVARATFRPEAGIVLVADATWREPTTDGGRHDTAWRLYRDGRLLKAGHATATLSGKPAQLISHIAAGSFPPGRYRAELSLDHGAPLTTSFEIIAHPQGS